MAAKFQVVFDCVDPISQARFWATALHYRLEPPPEGFDTWAAYLRSIGVPEDELNGLSDDEGSDSIIDPAGAGPRIWFQIVPEGKTSKNRIHFDLSVSGGRTVPIQTRRERVEAEAARLVAAGATRLRSLETEGLDHYAVAMHDPEGNEFDIN